MSLWQKIVKFTSDIYLSKYPMFLLYKPTFHKLKGKDIRKIIDNLQVGDILLRRFDGYLNTILTPGFWGHSAVYIGENKILHSVSQGVCEEDILDFCRTDSLCILRRIKFDVNNFIQKVIYVKEKDIKYDFEFEKNDDEYYCTELVNYLHDNIFEDDFKEIAGKLILTPDAIYKNSNIFLVFGFRN